MRQLLKISDVMHIFKISKRTVFTWIKKGILKPIKIGGLLRFDPADLQALMFRSRQGIKRILAIDDDPLLRHSLKMLLEKTGFEVTLASSCEEALELASKQRFDLIISDVRMPGKNGIETIQALHERNKRHAEKLPRVILMSAYEDRDIKKQAAALGIKHFISKPFEITPFVELIHQNLN